MTAIFQGQDVCGNMPGVRTISNFGLEKDVQDENTFL